MDTDDSVFESALENCVEMATSVAILVADIIPNIVDDGPIEKPKRFRKVVPRAPFADSVWWRLLVKGDCKVVGHTQHSLFRRRFGVTYARYAWIVHTASSWVIDPTTSPVTFGDLDNAVDVVGRQSVPLALKVLGALRMNCKGVCFDAIAELTGMSISTIQTFYHVFWKRFVDELYDTVIVAATTLEVAEKAMATYASMGFPGAIGSVDCTHVSWAKCPAAHRSVYSGKEKHPTISFQVICDHERRIQHVHPGAPGSRNDKTIQKYDTFIQDLYTGTILSDLEFTLLDMNGVPTVHRGGYLLSDNGYTRMRCIQCPIAGGCTRAENYWSCRLESIRKDVECLFGVLKGRYRILRSRMMFQSHEAINVCFKACCMLHNMNLDDDVVVDGAKDWTRDDDDDADIIAALRVAKRVARTGIAVIPDEKDDGNAAEENVVPVNNNPPSATYKSLRKALIEHYTYMASKKQNQWPGGN